MPIADSNVISYEMAPPWPTPTDLAIKQAGVSLVASTGMFINKMLYLYFMGATFKFF